MASWTGIIPVYVNNFNRLTATRTTAEFFAAIPGIEVIIVDNKSTYPPLLDWYARAPYKIIRLEGNSGHHAPWFQCAVLWAHTHKAMFGSSYYAVTDPDLEWSECPRDIIEQCLKGFERMPHAVKVGVGLRIDDVPEVNRERIHGCEQQYWARPLDSEFFQAPIDTTFALYRTCINHTEAMNLSAPTLRMNFPYVVRHLPWYLTKDNMPEEDNYYYSQVNTSNTWKP